MYRFLVALALIISTSSASHAENMPLRKFLLHQLTSSKYDYAEKKFTGIVFHYGRVVIDPDQRSLSDMESIPLIMEKGHFIENGVIHDVRGVEWVLKAGLDRPRLFTEFIVMKGFRHNSRMKILSSYPKMRVESVYTFKRHKFPIIPEYAAKQQELSDIQVALEIDRITNSKVGTAPGGEIPGFTPLPLNCSNLF